MKIPNARRHKRCRVNFLVKYQLDGKGEARITNVRDLGAGGIRFWADEKLAPHSILKVSICFPPLNRTVEAVAQVLRTQRLKKGNLSYSAAVGFLDLKREDRTALETFTENLSQNREALKKVS